MTAIVAGTVSHGTLRSEDLIESFMWVLKAHQPDNDLIEECEAILARANGAPLVTDYACELVGDLMDALDRLAPEGMHFGAHEGDGSDFGFWPNFDD